jgi:hypothetical protein
MILFRIEHGNTGGSMWYNPDGTPNRIVDSLTDKRLAGLPMDFDPRYRRDGKIWQCAAWDIEHLKHWFSPQDMADLIKRGFVINKFNAEEYVREENQVIFTKESITVLEDITHYFSDYGKTT